MIDFSLTDAQREVQRTARAFAEREILPRIRELDATAEYDRSLYEKMGAAGLLGPADPRAVRRRRDGLHRLRAAVRGDGARRYRLPRHPVGPHRAQLADAAAVGERGAEAAVPRAAGARREAGHLRPHRARRRLRRRQPGHHGPPRRRPLHPQRLARSGSAWPTPPTTSWSSPTSTASKGHKGITAFIVERSFPGFSSESLHGKLGVRAGNTGILTFSDCEVPAANRVGEEGEGFTIAMSAIDQGRYTVAAGSVGPGAGVPRRIGQVRARAARRSAPRSASTSS